MHNLMLRVLCVSECTTVARSVPGRHLSRPLLTVRGSDLSRRRTRAVTARAGSSYCDFYDGRQNAKTAPLSGRVAERGMDDGDHDNVEYLPARERNEVDDDVEPSSAANYEPMLYHLHKIWNRKQHVVVHIKLLQLLMVAMYFSRYRL